MFTALALARYMQDQTGLSLKKIIRTPRPLRDVTITVNGHQLTAAPQLDSTARDLMNALTH